LIWISLVLLTTIGAVGASIFHDQIGPLHNLPYIAIALLPALVLAYGMRSILMNIEIQRGNFTRTALVQIYEPVCSRGGSILLALAFGGYLAFILLSVLLGQLVAIALLIKHVQLKPMLQRWRELVEAITTFKATLR